MEPYQQRVIEEKHELDSKIEKLATFINSPRFEPLTEVDRFLLRCQLHSMKKYSNVLASRISRF